MRPMTRLISSILAGPALLLAPLAIGQSTPLVDPEPVTPNGRFMPGFGTESIVRTRYTVKADGTVADIEILGGFGLNPFLENTLKQTMSTWAFTPGTANGEKVDFFNQETTFAFRVDPSAPPMPMGPPGGGRGGPGGRAPAAPAEATEGQAAPPAPDYSRLAALPLGLSPTVKQEVDTITALVAEQEYEKAIKELDKVERRELRSVFDYSLVHEMKSSILMAMEDPFRALEESKLATLSTETPQGERAWFLTDEILENALRKRFLLAATLRQSGLAWESYEQLNEKFDMPESDPIHAQAAAVKAQIDSPDPLGMLARITDNVWTHTPTRRIFTVTDVDGRLNQITAHCERRNLELEYQEGVDWTLPDSLGACTLDFEGRDGTQFTLYEFAE